MRRIFALAALVFFSQGVLAEQNAPASMVSYRGQNGKSFVMRVTDSASGRIWGGSGNVYTDDSSIAAAVHAGLLRAGQAGTVTVTVLSGQASIPRLRATASHQSSMGSGSAVTGCHADMIPRVCITIGLG